MSDRPIVTRPGFEIWDVMSITAEELLQFKAWELAQLLAVAVGTNQSAAAIIADPESPEPRLAAAKRNFNTSLAAYERLYYVLGLKLGLSD